MSPSRFFSHAANNVDNLRLAVHILKQLNCMISFLNINTFFEFDVAESNVS